MLIGITNADWITLGVCVGVVGLLFGIEIYSSYFAKGDYSHSPGCKCPECSDWGDDELEDGYV